MASSFAPFFVSTPVERGHFWRALLLAYLCGAPGSYDKNCIDYSSLKTGSDDHVVRNNGIAFKVAEERFKVGGLAERCRVFVTRRARRLSRFWTRRTWRP